MLGRAGSPVGTSYLVFIDNFFSLGPRRDEVLRNLKDQLSQLGPEDRMAIVSWSGCEVEMLTSWTSSPRQLGDAIQNATYERTYGTFSRTFTLPEGADLEHAEAELKNGVLTVTVPKKPEHQPKKISLKSIGEKVRTAIGGKEKPST